MFLDVRCDRKEFLIDEGGDFIVGIGFGLQPNARASSWSSAEVEEHVLVLGLRVGEDAVDVVTPVDVHRAAPC